jgi:hypothetical protein
MQRDSPGLRPCEQTMDCCLTSSFLRRTLLHEVLILEFSSFRHSFVRYIKEAEDTTVIHWRYNCCPLKIQLLSTSCCHKSFNQRPCEKCILHFNCFCVTDALSHVRTCYCWVTDPPCHIKCILFVSYWPIRPHKHKLLVIHWPSLPREYTLFLSHCPNIPRKYTLLLIHWPIFPHKYTLFQSHRPILPHKHTLFLSHWPTLPHKHTLFLSHWPTLPHKYTLFLSHWPILPHKYTGFALCLPFRLFVQLTSLCHGASKGFCSLADKNTKFYEFSVFLIKFRNSLSCLIP